MIDMTTCELVCEAEGFYSMRSGFPITIIFIKILRQSKSFSQQPYMSSYLFNFGDELSKESWLQKFLSWNKLLSLYSLSIIKILNSHRKGNGRSKQKQFPKLGFHLADQQGPKNKCKVPENCWNSSYACDGITIELHRSWQQNPSAMLFEFHLLPAWPKIFHFILWNFLDLKLRLISEVTDLSLSSNTSLA